MRSKIRRRPFNITDNNPSTKERNQIANHKRFSNPSVYSLC